MTNMEYIKCLIAKLNKMIRDDEELPTEYEKLLIRKKQFNYDRNFDFWDTLNTREKKIYLNKGHTHSKAEYRRVRIELNRALLNEER